MKIDLHVHTKERSPCGRSPEREMVRAAMDRGLDALVFTDHGLFSPPETRKRLNAEFAPFKVFGGIEITIRPEMEDILVYGVPDEELETREWSYPALHEFVRARSGYLILAHPFRYKDAVALPVAEYPPDAIEVHSTNTGADDESAIRRLAASCGARLVTSSDAHITDDVGLFHIELPYGVSTERELCDALRAGQYAPCRDAARIDARNEAVRERESLIREAIARGVSPEDHQKATGVPPSRFRRVAQGKSYLI